MLRAIKATARLLFARHLLLSVFGVMLVTLALASRVVDRTEFADSDVRKDVMERWGAPIDQPSPSVRYVASGAVFNELRALALDRQDVTVDASMNYRKRGLVYFSGFDFALHGTFEAHNPESGDIDLVFVFPIKMRSNQVLLSDLSFQVDGKPAPVELSEGADKLVWTGRARPGEKLHFEIGYRGRGLDSFVWRLDPATRVNDFRLRFQFKGGDNFDYPTEVVPAGKIEQGPEGAALTWTFPSLESGVPVGLVLPSQKSFDQIIATAADRAWAFWGLLYLGALLLFAAHGRELRLLEVGLLASSYAIAFPLLGYLAAVMPFWAAAIFSLGTGCGLLVLVAALLAARAAARIMAGLAVLTLIVPALAVVLQGYTGLLYTLEATACLAALVILVARPGFRGLVERAILNPPQAPTRPEPPETRVAVEKPASSIAS